jgi:hypothetical protein
MEGNFVNHVITYKSHYYFTYNDGKVIQIRMEIKSDCSFEYFSTDDNRLVLKEFAYTLQGKSYPAGSITHVYHGVKGEEALLYGFYPLQEVRRFVGIKGAERKVCREFPDGVVQHFKGVAGEEHLVSIENPKQDLTYCFEGVSGKEHIISIKRRKDGLVNRYKGEAGEERRVSITNSEGETFFYEGEKGEEVIVHYKDAHGAVVYIKDLDMNAKNANDVNRTAKTAKTRTPLHFYWSGVGNVQRLY